MRSISVICSHSVLAVFFAFAGCTAAREVPSTPAQRTATTEDIIVARHFLIEQHVYRSLGLHGDTLILQPLYTSTGNASAAYRPVQYLEARFIGLDELRTVHLQLRHAQNVPARGDTLLVPLTKVEHARIQDFNSLLAVGTVDLAANVARQSYWGAYLEYWPIVAAVVIVGLIGLAGGQ